MSRLKLITPEHVLMNDDIHGRCTSGEWWPRIVTITKGCNLKQQRIVEQGPNKLYCTDFVVKKATATCKYMCVVRQSRVIKTVVVTGMNVTIYYDVHTYVCEPDVDHYYYTIFI